MDKPTVEQVAWVFNKLNDHFKEGGSFRYLIYNRMGFEPDNYQELYSAGGFALSQMANELIDYTAYSREAMDKVNECDCNGDSCNKCQHYLDFLNKTATI